MIRAAVAQGYGSAVQSHSGQDFPDCSRCRGPRSTDLRKFWGCDAKADHPVWTSGCGSCHGQDGECPACHGTNKVHQFRCPSSIVAKSHPALRVHLDLLMRSFRHYTERGALPVTGGWLDQSRSYLSAIDLIDAERSHWDGIRQDHQDKKRATEERKANSQIRGAR